MGFYLRKYVKVGLFRFNLSRSGVGVSGGVTGFRLGKGPKGAYVHMGRGGLYYRKYFSQGASPRSHEPEQFPRETTPSATGNMTLTESIAQDSTSADDDLIKEIRDKRNRIRVLPIAFILAILGLIWAVNRHVSTVIDALAACAALIACVLAAIRDKNVRTTVLMFDLDENSQKVFEGFYKVMEAFSQCGRIWNISARAVGDWKRNAGAGTIVDRQIVFLRFGLPPNVASNLEVPFLKTAQQALYFFPSWVLILSGRLVQGVPYDQLHCRLGHVDFREDGSVPSDAVVISSTWLYVNKSGSPDRRFANNREIPIARYGTLEISTDTGAHIDLHVSSLEAAKRVCTAFSLMTFEEKTGQIPGQRVGDEPLTITLKLSMAGPKEQIVQALHNLEEAVKAAFAERQKRYELLQVPIDQPSGMDLATFTAWYETRIAQLEQIFKDIAAMSVERPGVSRLDGMVLGLSAVLDEVLQFMREVQLAGTPSVWPLTLQTLRDEIGKVYVSIERWAAEIRTSRQALHGNALDLTLTVPADPKAISRAFAADAAAQL